jgi:recombination DNA repair RAD52 pathway protein
MTENSDNQAGLFSRWSRRKLNKKEPQPEELEQQASQQLDNQQIQPPEEVQHKDDLQHKPLEASQQAEIDLQEKQKEIAALFRQPEFNEVDHMNEYDEDFTQFEPLGDIVTTEMKRMLKLAEQKTRPQSDQLIEQATASTEPEPTEITSDEIVEPSEPIKDKEDNDLA